MRLIVLIIVFVVSWLLIIIYCINEYKRKGLPAEEGFLHGLFLGVDGLYQAEYSKPKEIDNDTPNKNNNDLPITLWLIIILLICIFVFFLFLLIVKIINLLKV